jgi:hypothetical protein
MAKAMLESTSIICAGGSSRVEIRDAIFSANEGPVLRTTEQAVVTLTGSSKVANNTHGSALIATGRSKIIITSGTMLWNNSAVRLAEDGSYLTGVGITNGGVLSAFDNSTVVVNGGVMAKANTAVGGGAFAVADYATLTITGPTTLANNTSHYWAGGAVAAYNHSQVRSLLSKHRSPAVLKESPSQWLEDVPAAFQAISKVGAP